MAVVAPRAWNEGGETVRLHPDPDEPVVAARTLGHHPFGFVYNPVPIWRELRARPPDVLDIHEEPAALATFEVLLLAKLAGVRAPALLYSAQNLDKRYPVPFRWFERVALRRPARCTRATARSPTSSRRRGSVGRS